MPYHDHHIDALPQGHLLHAYRIERVLGSGAFGITYLAEHGMLNTWHVIKEYLPDCGAREQNRSTVRPKSLGDKELFDWGLKSFYEEARLLHKISHPYIVKVTDLFEANSTAYFVMPYLEGVTLHEWMKQHPNPSQAELEAIFVPLLEGLKFIHDKGLLHRDVKPENIFITGNTNPVLIDFGSARLAIGQKSKALTQVLTPHFAPWEQYRSKGTFTPALDLYSLAACMYQSITGQLPEESPDRIEEDTQTKLAGSKYEHRYATPFLQAIDHGLAVYAKDRPQTAFAMQCELMNATPQPAPSDDPPPSPPPVAPHGPPSEPPSIPPAQPARKSRRPLLLAGLAILILLVGLAAYKISDQQAQTKDQAQWDEAQQLDDRCDFRSDAQGRLAEIHEAEERQQREKTRRLVEERRKAEEAARLAEERRKSEEAARLAEERRKAEEAARLAEERRKAEEAARLAEERRKAEEAARLAEERRKAEEAARKPKPSDTRTELHTGIKGETLAKRFTDNGDGTVTDNVTKLMWTKDANLFGHLNWDDAVSRCNAFSLNVIKSWRLPSKDELEDLYHAMIGGHPFTGVKRGYYWSSTPRAGPAGYAWSVGMNLGNAAIYYKPSSLYVWPVTQTTTTHPPAAPESSTSHLTATEAPTAPVLSPSRFTDNGDGTVTDNLTNLMWTKNASPIGRKNWDDAKANANSFSISGIGGWRLPTKDELVVLSKAMKGEHPFIGVQSPIYWSSTPGADSTFVAWYINIGNSSVYGDFKTLPHNVWPVRDVK